MAIPSTYIYRQVLAKISVFLTFGRRRLRAHEGLGRRRKAWGKEGYEGRGLGRLIEFGFKSIDEAVDQIDGSDT